MSYTNEPRVKTIRQKTGVNQNDYTNIYSDGIPIGADGKYIDMSSTLDLEQELKLGGSHYVQIDDIPKGGGTDVTEWYCNKSMGWKKPTKDVLQNITDYTVRTHFHYAYQLSEETEEGLEGILSLISADSDPYLTGRSSVVNYTLIVIELFKGYKPLIGSDEQQQFINNKLLHQRVSLIGENTYVDDKNTLQEDDDVYHEITSVWEDLDNEEISHNDDLLHMNNTGGNG